MRVESCKREKGVLIGPYKRKREGDGRGCLGVEEETEREEVRMRTGMKDCFVILVEICCGNIIAQQFVHGKKCCFKIDHLLISLQQPTYHKFITFGLSPITASTCYSSSTYLVYI
ncbi:hypothetical protein ACH5RR_003003 [Cinchona calisaya]|uniref:Uncharacterized protein n=1 Tax=Cinchona calisaya TaxID=153742 RepID=A0ABD3ATL0_9GENT